MGESASPPQQERAYAHVKEQCAVPDGKGAGLLRDGASQ